MSQPVVAAATTANVTPAAAPVPVPESGSGAPAWESFTPVQLAAIESARAAVRAQGPLQRDPKGTYGLICRACSKPNSCDVDFCTGCSFPSQPEDVQRLPDNIFKELVDGKDIGAIVRYRDDDTIVFDDKFPVSEHHVDVIPTTVYADITSLDGSHVAMLERLYALGKAEFQRRNIAWLPKDPSFDLDELIVAGYNYPVSVKHLHLHMALPPYKHEKCFQYNRWHSHEKVLNDLRTHGKVRLYCDFPNEAEGAAVQQRVNETVERVKQMQAQTDANASNGK